MPAGYRVLSLGEIDSTNAEAMRHAEDGDPGRLWITAAAQTRGRGRSGREWESRDGNLFASLLLRPDCPLDTALQLSLLAGVALFDAVQELSGTGLDAAGATLKWPNDLLVADKKIAGVLIETAGATAPDRFAVVVGTGLNVVHAPHGATCLADLGVRTTPTAALAALAARTASWLDAWCNGAGFPIIRSAWEDRALEVGRSISVKLGAYTKHGNYGGIDEMGALRLFGRNGETRITTGDVFLN